MLVRMWRKGNIFVLLVRMQTGAATLKNSMEVPQKIKNGITLWPSNCTTKYLFKGYKNSDLKKHMHPNIYSSTINNSQIMERTEMPIWWVDRESEYYSTIRKSEILLFAMTWMEVECITLSEISQRKTNTIWFYSYVKINKQMNKGE